MNFLGIGPGELVLILIIAVIVLGPDKIPETMRTLGKAMREIRSITEGFQKELNKELAEVTKEPPTAAKPAEVKPAPSPPAEAKLAEAVNEEPIPVNAELPPPYGPVVTTQSGAQKVDGGDGATDLAEETPQGSTAALAEPSPAEPAPPVTADQA
jgi:Tat protein translocase TatB subunit